MSEIMKENLNLNTALLTIVLGLSAWTVHKVSDLAEQQAAIAVKVQNLERVVFRPQ